MEGSISVRETQRGEDTLVGEAVELDSFTTSGYCSCPRYENTGKCVKCPVLAKAVQRVRELHSGAYVAEENIIELCTRIFAPVKGEHYIDSYKLLIKVLAYRHATPAMKKYAKVRLHKVLDLADSRTGVA